MTSQPDKNKNTIDQYITGLSAFVPKDSLPLLRSYLTEDPFHLRITGNRVSKKGDFRPDVKGKLHKISVNGTMNQYEFLITLVHEYAHLKTWNLHGSSVKPHGQEWKDEFRKYLTPFILNNTFPDELKESLKLHLRKPPASSCTDIRLQKSLMKYDHSGSEIQVLDDLSDGEVFVYGKDRKFVRENKRRTRIKCLEIKTGKRYLFQALTPVEKVTKA